MKNSCPSHEPIQSLYRFSFGTPITLRSGKVPRKRGSALIIALWAIVLLSMLVSSLAYQMHLEARLASHYRKRMKARHLALGGIEWAKFMLYKSNGSSQDDEDEYGEQFYFHLQNIQNAVGINGMTQELGEGQFTVDILPEQGRRNINTLTEDDWREMLEQAGLPRDRWSEFIDPFMDWIDADNNNRRKGAEENDSFYKDKDYEVKNAPIDTIDELLLIKNWTRELLYGGPGLDDGDPPILGIARWVTTWGDGKVNINTASADVLQTMPELDEFDIEQILERRTGIDEITGTEDDGFRSAQEVTSLIGADASFANRITTNDKRYIRVKSTGEVGGVTATVWCVYLFSNRDIMPVFWEEELREQ